MPAVTQRVEDYLGGVSRQSDDKKLPGQVEECINGYPDPTFGLTKRPGFQWLGNLGTGTTYDDSKWFFISRTDTEKYIVCITPATYNNATPPALTANGTIAAWNAVTFAPCNVYFDALPWAASQAYAVGDLVQNDSGKVYQCDTAGTSAASGGPTGTGADIQDNTARWDYLHSGQAQAYLTGTRTQYDALTIQDKSIVVNSAVKTAILPAPTFNANRQATIKLVGTTQATKYNISINGTAIPQYTSGSSTTYDQVLSELKTRIVALNITGIAGTDIKKTKDSLHILNTQASFTITATGGQFANQLTFFQDQVATLEELPSESRHNHVVKIINSGSLTKAFYLKFVAEDGNKGPGYWKETLAPDTSTGLDNSTMPHELLNTAVNTFVFQRASFKAREVGDDDTNSHPSFVGRPITQAFFHNNRLGFLSGDTVSMSQSSDFFNMYFTSGQTVTDADPIDLSASTVKPVALHSVLPSTQGLVLFSANQQFLMGSTEGILTPTKTVIRTIANYEMDTKINPVDTGTTINFISKTPSYTRVFAMVTRGENENPQVADIGKVVNEWIPSNMDTMIASAQNQFIAFSGQSSKYIYLFRQYTEGKDILLQTWFNWEAPGTVQTIAADSDELFAVTKQQGGQLTLSKASLSQSPEDAIIVNNDGQRLNPCIDLYAPASSVTFDTAGEFSKCFIPYADATDLTPIIIIKGTTATGQFIESGFTITPERVVESGNTYFKVPFKNLTSVASDVIVGYKYDFDIILPKTYYRLDEEMKSSDFTANLTIARMKFGVGLSGVMGFKLKSKGIRQGKRAYVADGVTTEYEWIPADFNYIDDDQLKVKINNVETSAFTVNTSATPLPKITLNAASSELKTLSGNGSTKTFDLTFIPNNLDIIKVKVGGVLTTDYNIVEQFIHFDSAPASGTNNILVYSADDILIYLDEWYNLNPVITADQYLANDIPIKDQTVFTLPIHQKTDNFTLRLFNDSPFPVSVNSMMWEGIYSPRFYRRT